MIPTHSALFRSLARPGMTFSLIGLGALLACSVLPANAQYADWYANPPKVLANERVGSGGADAVGSGRQFPNSYSFAAVTADGSIRAWGDRYNGGSNAPTGTGFTAVFSNRRAFAALKADGSISTWGAGDYGGSGAPTGTGFTAVYSTPGTFAALNTDGSISAWGDNTYGGCNAPAGGGFAAVYSNGYAFAALKADGSISAWGRAGYGGSNAPAGPGYTTICSTQFAFAALKSDGSISAWGNATYGGSNAPTGLGFTAIYSNSGSFAAMKADGSITTWGNAYYTGSNAPTSEVFTAVYSNSGAFAALKPDGSISAWGAASYGGSGAPSGKGFNAVYSTSEAFAVLNVDGSISTWGSPFSGGSNAPTGGGFTAVYGNNYAFAALKADGSISAWGNSSYGGTGAPTGKGFTAVYCTSTAFAALNEDGTITSWGGADTGGTGAPTGNDFTSIQSVLNFIKGPVVKSAATAVTSSSATLSGEVVMEGQSPVIGRGFVYALAAVTNPKIGDPGVTQVADSGSGLGSYSTTLSGLASNTAYVLKSYVTDSDGTTYSATMRFSTNVAPVITSHGGVSSASVSIAENSSSVTTVSATDADAGQAIAYSITGGADASRFAIGSSSGALTFVAAPNFEVPVDANADNVYQVIVTATDNGNTPKSATQTLNVTVTNLADSGEIAVEQPAASNVATGESVVFGGVTVGQPKDLVFTVRSSGEVALLLSGASFSGRNAGDFTLVGGLPSSIDIGSSATFTVRFTPSAGGARAAVLSLSHNDQTGGESPFVINLSGTGATTSTLATYTTATSQVLGGWVNNGNFTIGSPGNFGTVGNNWPAAEGPEKAVDGNAGVSGNTSKFLLFQNTNAGLILKPTNSSVVFNRMALYTGNDAPERDPTSYIIYGSNSALSGSAGTNIPISSLTKITEGTLTMLSARSAGPNVVQFANSTAYTSYVVVFPTVRSTVNNNCTQVSEVQLLQGMNPPYAVAMGDARGGELSGSTFNFGNIGTSNPGNNWPGFESPDHALDGNVNTKFLFFRPANGGIVCSPLAGPAAVNRFTLWTANDAPERDPIKYQVYGFATRVTQTGGSLNVGTAGTLLVSGNLTLPDARNAGPVTVEFTNSTAYASYLVVFPAVKYVPITSMTQISELQFAYHGVPAFALSSSTITVAEDSGSYSSTAFATGITPGIGDIGQTVSLACTNDSNALFSTQPAISANGTLTFTPAANTFGRATVSVVATDSTGLSSAPQTFAIEVSPGAFSASQGSASSSQFLAIKQSGFTHPVTLTAPAGYEISTDGSNFSSSLDVNQPAGIIQSVYRGDFNTPTGTIWEMGSGREHPNRDAFAALKSDGSVVTWGDPESGGDSSSVAAQLNSAVSAIYSNFWSYAALKDDGSVVMWGNPMNGGSFSVTSFDPDIDDYIYQTPVGHVNSGVVEVYSTSVAYAALKSDGSVVTWGDAGGGGDSSSVAAKLTSGVRTIRSTGGAFAALKNDGSVVTWGDIDSGGDSLSVAASLSSEVTALYSNGSAFAAVKSNGSVVAWGHYSQVPSATAGKLSSGVQSVQGSNTAFAALKDDGSVVAWGDADTGGDSTSVAANLSSGVSRIYSNDAAFAALKGNGSVVTWGFALVGGDSTSVASKLTSGVTSVSSTNGAFAALKWDGSVVTWGAADVGGDSNGVASRLKSGVTAVYSNINAFAALKNDGSVVTWGADSTAGSTGLLSSGVIALYARKSSFAAVKNDGSVVTWGNFGGQIDAPSNIGAAVPLPATIHIRLASTTAVGSVSGNLTLTSSGSATQTVALNGTVIAGPDHTHQELWRFANFGSYTSDASAADAADPDGDGLNNLLEYALGTGPNSPGVIPAVLALNGVNLEYTYTRSTAAKDNGVTYQIEWSETLEAGSWSTETVTQQITSTQEALETVKASVPAGTGGKRFLRLRVGSAPLQTP